MKKNNTKVIIFDSSTIINFAMNGLMEEFRELKKNFDGKFLITKEVAEEIVTKPLTIKRFELEALKIRKLIEEKTLEMPLVLGINDKEISDITLDVMKTANNIYFGKGNAIQIVHSGESSCIALCNILRKKGIESVISVDERTVRMLCEKPENLAELLQKKLHTEIQTKEENFDYFKDYKFIRSAELMYVAYKKGFIKFGNHQALDAILYALKFNGCSISDEEISEIEKIG
ncbi:Uncharacterised protein [uncultured archaeon]|nr:Uncharacterised protein [uncultured archaeon]